MKITPDEARIYLESRRWPNGVICPECGSARVKRRRDSEYFRCNVCDLILTVRTNTVFARSKIPLDALIAALKLMAVNPDVTLRELVDATGVTIKTAMLMRRRINQALKATG